MKTKMKHPEEVQIDFLTRHTGCSILQAKIKLKDNDYDLIKAYRNIKQNVC